MTDKNDNKHSHNEMENEHDDHSQKDMKNEQDEHAGHDMHSHHEKSGEEDKHSHHEKSGKVGEHSHRMSNDEHAGHNKNSHHKMMIEDFKKRFWVSLILTIPVLLLSTMIQSLLGLRDSLQFNQENYIIFAFSSIIYFYGGLPFLKGIYSELKKKQPGMMTLIAVAITVSYVYSSYIALADSGNGFFWELATLIDIMLLGHWIEMRSILSASRALEELAKLLPNIAHRVSENGDIIDVELTEINVNDKILIKPGEKIPSDGEVIEGNSSVNESMLTGESRPVSKKKGDKIIAGSINGEGSLTIEVKQVGNDTFLSKVIDLVNKAQESKSKTQNLANKAALILTLIAIFAGVITFFIWEFFTTQNFAFAIERTVTVMVITCPHALGLAVPLVVAVSTGIAAKNGFLIRNRTAFENARNITAVVFDKTGTLTEGKFGVTDVVSFDDEYDRNEILKYAAALESNSQHPIASGIKDASKDSYKIQDFESITGKGVKGNVNGKLALIVSPNYADENDISYNKNVVGELQKKGYTSVILVIENKAIGVISLGDKIREDSRSAIAKLQEMDIQCMMITGDNKKTAEFVAKELGLDEYFAEVMPEAKSSKIKGLQDRGLITAMIGDGVNDAPALAQADVGIAIGAGSDVAIETADIILIKNKPQDVVSVISMAKSTYKKMVQNLWWATGYNVVAIPLAAGVLFSYGILLSPALGAGLMTLSTIIVAINAKLLKI
ncbi:MAG: cadmium-translocating P-type ATPase [Melioribacteraceae bacterium]|nr:cadmium-translocating P-type ATPase [Melioribacteraceae bacterium]